LERDLFKTYKSIQVDEILKSAAFENRPPHPRRSDPMTDLLIAPGGIAARLEALWGRFRRRQPSPASGSAPMPETGPLRGRRRYKQSYPAQQDSSCVIIGPVSSGKSALLYSLRHCVETMGHSYHGRFDVTITSKNQDLRNYEARLRESFLEGLQFEATRIDEFVRPEFAITARARYGAGNLRPGEVVETSFTTFDGSGGLLLENESQALSDLPPAILDDYHRARAELEKDLKTSESFVICLPIDAGIKQQERTTLSDYLYEFRQDGADYQVRQVVVCFTKYERLGTRDRRHAFRRLASRPVAAQAMREALTERMPGISLQLKEFDRTPDRSVWCAPLSTYGFIPGHGGANYDPKSKLLRTRAFREDEGWTPARPYSMELALQDLWRPFLTVDPFVFIATGVAEGTLIHRIDELL